MASRKLEDAVEELQQKVPLIIEEYEKLFTDRKLIITATLRPIEEQQKLYAQGRTSPPLGKKFIVTNVDGIKKPSNHNPLPNKPKARAVDFGVLIGGKYMGDPRYYEYLGPLSLKFGLNWGGYWKSFKDWCHIEIREP
jgi:peptidoglycan LD-endopeptidase CwlK